MPRGYRGHVSLGLSERARRSVPFVRPTSCGGQPGMARMDEPCKPSVQLRRMHEPTTLQTTCEANGSKEALSRTGVEVDQPQLHVGVP